MVCGDRETGRLVVAHPQAAMVSITGSTAAGRQVAASAAEQLKRAHLELGGKASAVVLADADLAAAVDGIVLGSVEEAVALADGVDYALAASVWTRDHASAMRLTGELDFGCVWVNTHLPLAAEMPHGGFKRSGYGSDLSHYGLEDYTRIKHVMHAF